jgi:hypothetical protein
MAQSRLAPPSENGRAPGPNPEARDAVCQDGLAQLARAVVSAAPEDARRQVAAQVEEMFGEVDLEAVQRNAERTTTRDFVRRILPRIARRRPSLGSVELDARAVCLADYGHRLRHPRDARPAPVRRRGSRRCSAARRGSRSAEGSDPEPSDQPPNRAVCVHPYRGSKATSAEQLASHRLASRTDARLELGAT